MKMMVVMQQKHGMPEEFIYFDRSGRWWYCRAEGILDKMTDQSIHCQRVTPQHACSILVQSGNIDVDLLQTFIECLLEHDPKSTKL